MKLLSFEWQGRERFGALTEAGVADLTGAPFADLGAALADADGMEVLADRAEATREAIPLDEIRFLQPITRPDKIICVGLNYRKHAEEAKLPVPAKPSLFVRFPGSQVGHLEPVVCPRATDAFDYEAELAVVIGRRAHRVTRDAALSHVAGYACFAENSARDWQRHAAQVTPGKNFAASGAFGPWLVTADEIPDPAALTLTGRLNGEVVQQDSIGALIFGVAELIEYISTFAVLLPGDVIATGTPAGVGLARQRFLTQGDVFEVEIDRIGTLRNQVIAEA